MEQSNDNAYNQARIKAMLEDGEKLTVAYVWTVLKTFELRTYLSALRKSGVCILSKWCVSPSGTRNIGWRLLYDKAND